MLIILYLSSGGAMFSNEHKILID